MPLDLLEHLNPEQAEAVTYQGGPLLVVAGAGSGKTRVITHRIAHLVSQGQVPHYGLLAITFTNKAAREMKSRVADLLETTLSPADLDEMWVSTFHSACTRILHRHAGLLGYPDRFSIYDATDSTRAVKAVMEAMGLDTKRLTPKFFRDQISRAKNDLLSPEQLLDQAEERELYYPEETCEIYQRYQQLLKESGAMDFDDLLVQTDTLFRQHPETLSRYQRRFAHVLIDEYQDTNAVQNSIALRLAEGSGNLCAVGDADQSIYRFRGARIGNINQLQKALPNLKLVLLEENYRSTQNILHVANNIIKHNPDRFDRTLRPHKPAAASDPKVTVFEAKDDRSEAHWVANRMHELLADNPQLNWSDFAVLYRTNAQSVLFEQAFTHHDIPYKVVGGIGFFDRKEVRDAMAFMRSVVNPRDAQSINRVINCPPRGIGAKTLTKLADFAANQDISYGEALLRCEEAGISAKARAGVKQFLELCQGAEANFERGPEEVLEQLLEQSGYLPALHQQMEKELADLPISAAAGQIDNLQRLLTVARDYDTVDDFVDYMALLTRVDETTESLGLGPGGGGGGIAGGGSTGPSHQASLMTVHAAKGLEFEVVFLAGLEDNVFPHRNSMQDPAELEEERRLAYVACTRAKQQLSVSYAQYRRQYTETEFNLPSRFIGEMVGDIHGDNNEFAQFTKGQNANWADDFAAGYQPRKRRAGKTSYADADHGYDHDHDHDGAADSDLDPDPDYDSDPDPDPDYSTDSYSRSYGHSGSNGSSHDPTNNPSHSHPNGSASYSGEPLCVDDQIEHQRWGRGVVKEVKGQGVSEEIVVEFPEAGLKHLLVSAAPISKVP